MSTTESLRWQATNVANAARIVRRRPTAKTIASIARAASVLRERSDDAWWNGLEASTGLDRAMARWGLETTLREVNEAALVRTLAAAGGPGEVVWAPAGLAVVVLAGNLFTACVRGMLLPLLFGNGVIAKASSRDDILPRALVDALREIDPELGAAVGVVTFPGGETTLEDTLLAQADSVSVYGSDRTIAELRARTPSTATFVPHGHGLGVAYVPKATRSPLDELARALALDVAAYDQRGCLSPHAVFVEHGGPHDGLSVAKALANELESIERTLPRGALPMSVGAQQLQWRGVGAARGTLIEGDGFAVSYEGKEALRVSPGYRNVAILECENEASFVARLPHLGTHLKCIGVGTEVCELRAFAARLQSGVAPRVCAIGAMQTPRFDAVADGDVPHAGLVRYLG